MNLAQAQSRYDAMLPPEQDDSAFQRRIAQIDGDPDRTFVGELLFDDLPYVPSAAHADDDAIEQRDAAVKSAMAVTAYAIDAFPIIERLTAGLPLTPYQSALIPRFFRALKPWIEKEPIVIRQAAEDGL